MKLKIITNDFVDARHFFLLLLIRIIYPWTTIVNLTNSSYNIYGGNNNYGIDFNITKEIVAVIVFVAVTCFFLKIKDDYCIRSYFLNWAFILYFIPLNAAFGLNNTSILFFIESNFYFLFMIIMLADRSNESLLVDESEEEGYKQLLNQKKVIIVCCLICLAYILYKLLYNGFYFTFSLSGDVVYANRLENNTYFNSRYSGSALGYLIELITELSSYAAPLLLLLSLESKKHIQRILGIGVAVLCILSQYAVFSSKANILLLPVVIFIYFTEHKPELLKKLKYIFEGGIFIALAYSLVETLRRHGESMSYIYYLILRRLMYLPAWLNYIYYDYFSKHTKIWGTQDMFILKNILPDIHSDTINGLINKAYFNGEIVSPNTGMFGDAYMQIGVIGIIIYPIIFKLILSWADRIYKKYGITITILFSVNVTLQLTNVSILRGTFVLSFILITYLLGLLPRFSSSRVIYNNSEVPIRDQDSLKPSGELIRN